MVDPGIPVELGSFQGTEGRVDDGALVRPQRRLPGDGWCARRRAHSDQLYREGPFGRSVSNPSPIFRRRRRVGAMAGGQVWPNNLPEQLTSFVGRGREREQVRDALGSARLLVLTGAGGAGKTRLARQVAADAAESFPDGGWWVELAPLAEAELVGAELARALGVRPLPGRTQAQAAATRLENDRALVVLDNCEHVTEAAAELAETLLRACPDTVVMATSREPLGLPGESD